MKILGKMILGLSALMFGSSIFAACTTQHDGAVEGEFESDGTSTEIALDSSASNCSGWGEFYAYVYVDGGSGEPLGSWPGKAMNAAGDGIYTLSMDTLGEGLTYKLIYNNNAGSQFDVGSFVKGDSKIFNASGDWTEWHWTNTPDENPQTEPEGGNKTEPENPPAEPEPSEQNIVLPGYLRGGDGIGGDSKPLTFSDIEDGKIAVYTWKAAASGWGEGDGNIAFKITEYGDWNQHEGSTAYGGVTWSGSSNRTQIAVGSDFVELKKCMTDEEAVASDNIIGTGFTVGNNYTMTVKVLTNGTVYLKIAEVE